ncbi:beta-alanine-activating enzyme isoform X1 [Alosa pseudoharengus]|uniref:beta-alanine-activating enzyme isoform X1 n=1 Tax=Alosa pseudoharengus TaxID=34774 RepID=UPI003F8BE001
MELKTLHEMVQEAASVYSSRTAVTFNSGTEMGMSRLTYEELLSSSNKLTNLFRSTSLQNEHLIGLFCYPDVNLPLWVLGILQLPSAYLPLNPEVPPVQTVRILDRCKLTYCGIQNELLQQFQADFSTHLTFDIYAEWPTQNLTLIRIHRRPSTEAQNNETNAENRVQGLEDLSNSIIKTSAVMTDCQRKLAYALHTSGTTGQPKIVRVPHCCIVSNIMHLRTLFEVTADDVIFLASPLTFDPSVVEMFLALTSGAQLLIVPTVIKRMPSRLAQVLFTHHQTTVLQATPTLLGRFGRRVLQQKVLSSGSSLRVLALGGEACPSPAVLRSWRQEGNRTCIFNLYGTTEVSCWATYHRVSQTESTHSITDSVPLGEPLMDTVIEVRDDNGQLVTEGEGQVFIGGQDRVCLLDDEETTAPGTMRATGDWVSIRDAQLFYIGRKDSLVKRHGQQLHLDAVQQVVESLTEVEACAVSLCEGSRLVAFIVLSPSHTEALFASSNAHHGDQVPYLSKLNRDAVSSTSIHLHGSPVVSSDDRHGESGGDGTIPLAGLERSIQRRLSDLLPSHAVPDSLVLIPTLPLTSHGKVALGELKMMYERHREHLGTHKKRLSPDTLKKRVQTLWKDTLGLSEDMVVEAEANFLLSGGDSLQALRFCDSISVATGISSAGLLEVVLDGSYLDILNHVTMATFPKELDLDTRVTSKRQHRDPEAHSPVPPKRHIEDPSMTVTSIRPVGVAVALDTWIVGYVVRRAGEVVKIGHLQAAENRSTNESAKRNECAIQQVNSETDLTVTVEGNENLKSPHASRPPNNSADSLSRAASDIQAGTSVDTPRLSLRVRWSSDTGRCVDASPVLMVESVSGAATVFIGSHSHRMQALDLGSGELRWERVLGDRLESSAAVSACGTLIVVGCYDGQVYFLRVDSGETWWTFETKDAVKSSPTVDPFSGLVYVGSHDGHVYALNPQEKSCVWKRHCGGGAVFSSPCLHPALRLLYAATLRGHLLCINSASGAPVWTNSREVPFFSSPCSSSSGVFIGSVDGNIYGFSHTGEKLWQFTTGGPVFSSPCVVSAPPASNQRLVCGSHDGCVYSLSSTDGSLLWKFQTAGKVYSSPFVFRRPPERTQTLVAVASTDGTVWVLNGEDGTVCASLSLPGELFSSPLVWEQTLVIGCRNDYVYCLELTQEPVMSSA